VVVDVSGSMGTLVSAKGVEISTLSILDIVKHSIRTIMETLNDKDRLSIVKYSDVATVVAPLTHVDVKGKKELEHAITELSPGGMTNLWDGS